MAYMPSIDRERCSGCEECIELCTAGVFEIRRGKAAVASAEACLGCKACVAGCKEQAIVVCELKAKLSPICASLLKDLP